MFPPPWTIPLWDHTLPGLYPTRNIPPPAATAPPPGITKADGTHPTGVRSCLCYCCKSFRNCRSGQRCVREDDVEGSDRHVEHLGQHRVPTHIVRRSGQGNTSCSSTAVCADGSNILSGCGGGGGYP